MKIWSRKESDPAVVEAANLIRELGYTVVEPNRVDLELPNEYMRQVFFGVNNNYARISASETHLAAVDRLCELVLNEKESREVRHTLAKYLFGIKETSHEFYRALGQYRKWYRDAEGTYEVSTY